MKESSLFRPETIKQGPEGGRTLSRYEEVLDFKKEDLENKAVLDLGAGPGGKFAKELENAGIHAHVVSLSPDYIQREHRQPFQATLPEKLRSFLTQDQKQEKSAVAAVAERLPFQDESFDKTLALFSVSVWSERNYKLWLPEIIRTLKSGGEAKIGPFHPPKMDVYDGDILFRQREEMKKYIEELGYTYKYIPGPESGQEVLVLQKQKAASKAQEGLPPEAFQENIQKILDTINIEMEGQKKPKLSASEYAGEQFSDLEKSFDSLSLEKGPSVVAVVRCWNKKEKDLAEFLERIERFKQSMPSLRGVLLVINKDGEKNGSVTEESLKMALGQMNISVPVVPLQVEGYSWTAGLNSGAAVLNEMCLEKGIDRKDLRVANFSFDTDLDEEGLKKCSDSIQENEFVVTARKTSDGESPFVSGHGGGELWDRFKKMLRSPRAAKLSELAYTMRNTFNVIALEDIISMGGFNPLCNGEAFTSNHPEPLSQMKRPEEVAIAGMEDIEFFMRLVFRALQKGDVSMLKELRTAMDDPVFYRDTSWENLHELKKIDKIGNEMIALSLILSELSGKKTFPTQNAGETKTIGLVKDFYVPRVMQDFALRKEGM